jgi:hypothetical protein
MKAKVIALISVFLIVMPVAVIDHKGKSSARAYLAESSAYLAPPSYSNKTRDINTEKGSITLFEANITIPNNNHWSGVYDIGPDEAFLIYLKTDGNPVNLYILDENSFSLYLRDKKIYTYNYFQHNVIEGWYLWEGDVDEYTLIKRISAMLLGKPLTEKRYVVIENFNNAVISGYLEVNKAVVSA